MGRRVALTALMTDPGVEAAAVPVATPEQSADSLPDPVAAHPSDPMATSTSAQARPPQSGAGDSGEGDSGAVRSGAVRSDAVRSDAVQLGPVHASSVDAGPVQPEPVQSGPVHSGQVHSGQVHSGPVHQSPLAKPSSVPSDAHRQPPSLASTGYETVSASAGSASAGQGGITASFATPTGVVRTSGSSVRSVARVRGRADRPVSGSPIVDPVNVDPVNFGRVPVDRTVDRATVDLTARELASPGLRSDEMGEEELLFSDLERKEARLRWDQIEDLSRLAKRLNRARRGQPGRRITENTLIRVALDYLLEHQQDLGGRTESELLDELRAAR